MQPCGILQINLPRHRQEVIRVKDLAKEEEENFKWVQNPPPKVVALSYKVNWTNGKIAVKEQKEGTWTLESGLKIWEIS